MKVSTHATYRQLYPYILLFHETQYTQDGVSNTCAFIPSNTKYPIPQYFPSFLTLLLLVCQLRLFSLLIVIFLIKLSCISPVHDMVQAVICQQLIMKASGHSMLKSVIHFGNGTDSFQSTSVFHCTIQSVLFIHLPTLHYFRNWQHHYIKHKFLTQDTHV